MSRRFVIVPIATLILTPVCLAQTPLPSGSLPTRRALERLQLEKHWMGVVPLGAGEQLVLFNVVDGQLFAQTNHGNLHVYDAETGRYQWHAQLEKGINNPLPVSVNSDQVFATALKSLHAIHRWTGRPIWKVQLENIPSSGTICDEEVVAVGLRSGKLQGFTVRDHSKDTPPGVSAGSFAWAWQTRGILKSRPLVTPRVVTFASEDGRVYTVQKGEGRNKARLLYRYLTSAPITASLATHGNRTVIAGSHDNNLYGFDLFTADTRWIIPTGSAIDQEPLVSGDDVVLINQRGRLMLIDGRDGTIKWDHHTDGHKILALSPNRIYVGNAHNDLSIYDRATGEPLHSTRDTRDAAGLDRRALTLSFPNYHNDRLYGASPQGILFCAREAGRLQPVPLRAPNTPPFGTIPPDGLQDDTPSSAAPAVVPVPTGNGSEEAAGEDDTEK